MKNAVFLPNTEFLDIQDGETLYYGGNQDWYTDPWKQKAGCGPTSCANLMNYLAKTHAGCEALCPYESAKKAAFIRLMEDVWEYVTPGNRGVNSTDIFVNGAKRYGEEKGVPLVAKTLPVSPIHSSARSYNDVSAFVSRALEGGFPVAFLNLSNGTLKNLDSWHWVTIVALHGDNVMIYDQSKAKWIDLRQWLSTSIMGGGFVSIEKA